MKTLVYVWTHHKQKVAGGVTASVALIAGSGLVPVWVTSALTLATGLGTIWFAIWHDILAAREAQERK